MLLTKPSLLKHQMTVMSFTHQTVTPPNRAAQTAAIAFQHKQQVFVSQHDHNVAKSKK
jgi:hypothetical protein